MASEGRGAADPVGVLVAAAGRSRRAGPGEPKQFREIAGVPMLLRALHPFTRHPAVHEIVVALPEEFARHPPAWLDPGANGRLRLVAGGATRARSVRAALAALSPACTVVLVHDAARPFVAPETIDAVIAAARRGVTAVPGVTVADTLKRADGPTRRVLETVDRAGLWCAHTPQGFPRAVLEDAFRSAGARIDAATDEAMLVEACGHPVELVPDRRTNIKVTTADDFALARALAAP